MPTPKQVRFHFGRIERAHDKLQDALNAAHRADVLEYTDFALQSPCKTHSDTWERILATTEKQLASAMRQEIRRSK
jgi:hypothetical protein